MQDPEIKAKQQRRYKRWPTSIPCTVLWEDRTISGELANISFGGALVAGPSATPPVGCAVTLVFHYQSEVALTSSVDSQVVHTSPEASDAGGLGGFGLEFQGPLEEIRSKLLPLIEKLSGETFFTH